MTLDEVRTAIDSVDSQMKPLFLQRMECAKQVAEVKAKTGGDVFVLERELAIIEKRAGDVSGELKEEYIAFLRTLMSISRRYQYGQLKDMQEQVLKTALDKAGLDKEVSHTRVHVGFVCKKSASDLNLYLNMAKLNAIEIQSLSLETKGDIQNVEMELEGNLLEEPMKRLICQLGKEAESFVIKALK